MSMSTNDPAAAPWHLDKRIPVALILTILAQTFAAGVWLSSLNSRVAALELSEAGRPARLEVWNNDRARLAVVESNLVEIRRSLTRIEDRLEASQN